jgi:hypothetical protein
VSGAAGGAAGMRTLGVDLAADPRRTAACAVTWAGAGQVDIEPPQVGLDDSALRRAAGEGDWLGIDAPFAWPTEFVDAVSAHRARGEWPADYKHERLVFRMTDRFVRDRGRRPLSVSTDRIGVTAMRCARLLAELAEQRGRRVDLTGADRGVEGYPGAALAVWLPGAHRYRGPGGAEARAGLLRELGQAAPWLRPTAEVKAACAGSDHALDALIAALVTRAAALGRTHQPTPDQRELARVEGWIHVPRDGTLADLNAP